MTQEIASGGARSTIEEEKASMEPTPSKDVEKALGDNAATSDSTDEPEYPPMQKVIAIMISLYLAIFLVSLVRQ